MLGWGGVAVKPEGVSEPYPYPAYGDCRFKRYA